MTTAVTVREYAWLSTESVGMQSLDRAQVSASAFDWLCQLSSSFSRSGAALVQLEDRRSLKLDNYVGVVETPCGTRIEILPKIVDDDDSVAESRALLQRMIMVASDLPARETSETSLQLFDVPLSEWVIGRFLAALDRLVKRGIRSDYVRVESLERYLRGQIDAVRQLRQHAGRQHQFHIRHDEFIPDRAENRLLKRALDHVCRVTNTPLHWRLACELKNLLQEVPPSRYIEEDFRQWKTDRLMAHYLPIRTWCEIILYRQMPFSQVGNWHGISMLFPMERLFERYVAASLRRSLVAGARLVTQAASQSLCEHDGGNCFRLKPDLLIEYAGNRWVLDTKWKRLDARNKSDQYGLKQSDFYQLFAYGQKYLPGIGEMVLIYPGHRDFAKALPLFQFTENLKLWVLPFDLEKECLAHEPGVSLPLREFGWGGLSLLNSA